MSVLYFFRARKFFEVIIIFLIIDATVMASDQTSIRYFKGYVDNSIPHNLNSETTFDEVKDKRKYYKAYFSGEVLTKVETISKGQSVVRYHYSYYASGNLKEVRVEGIYGEVSYLFKDEEIKKWWQFWRESNYIGKQDNSK